MVLLEDTHHTCENATGCVLIYFLCSVDTPKRDILLTSDAVDGVALHELTVDSHSRVTLDYDLPETGRAPRSRNSDIVMHTMNFENEGVVIQEEDDSTENSVFVVRDDTH